MVSKKLSVNERRLAELLAQACGDDASSETAPTWYYEQAAFLARRGVLAVNAKTVPERAYYLPDGKKYDGCCGDAYYARDALRRLARGKP